MCVIVAATLERNSYITIAHVNPECYNSVPLNTNNGQPLALPPGYYAINNNHVISYDRHLRACSFIM